MKSKITFVLLLTCVPSIVWACSCAPKQPISVSLARSDAVVYGRCITFSVKSEHERVARFEILKTFKGDAEVKVLDVTTGESGASCGFDFVAGRYYVVYMRILDGVARTSICSRTMWASGPGSIQDEEFVALSMMHDLPQARWAEFDPKPDPDDPFLRRLNKERE
jgi:hypothetical protein